MAIKANKVINGTFGAVWIDGDKMSNIKSFESKLTFQYEEVRFSEDPSTHQKFMGYSGEGTMVLHKVDSRIVKKIHDGIKVGTMPEITIIGKLADPAADGAERVQFNEVTFDEVTLLKFENGTLGEEEVPFKFANYTLLETI